LKPLIVIIIVGIILGCSESKETTSQERILHVFSLDTLRSKYPYSLTIITGHGIIRYSYQNEVDQSKNMTFIFDDEKQILQFAGDKYMILNDDKLYLPQIKDYIFSFYHNSSEATDLTEPIIFNEEYGILGIGNSMAPNFIYLKEDNLEVSQLLNQKL